METIKFINTAIQAYVISEEEISEDNLNFLKENINNTLFLHEIDSKKLQVLVSKYENSKKIMLPAYLFDLNNSEKEDLNEDSNSKQNQNNIIKEIFLKHKPDIIKYGAIGLLLGYIIIKPLISSNADMLTSNVLQSKQEITQEIQVKNEFDLLTEKANKNREVISKELQEQKRLRDLLNESVNQVKTLENENNDIRNTLISRSQ